LVKRKEREMTVMLIKIAFSSPKRGGASYFGKSTFPTERGPRKSKGKSVIGFFHSEATNHPCLQGEKKKKGEAEETSRSQ